MKKYLRLALARAHFVVLPGLALVMAACANAGGSIESSPYREGFNHALDRCENITSNDEREDCYDMAMTNYKTKYQQWLDSGGKKKSSSSM